MLRSERPDLAVDADVPLQSVDWWSFGTLLYELLTGDPPFRAKDSKRLCEKIMQDRVRWRAAVPRSVVDYDRRSIPVGALLSVTQLLLPKYLSPTCHSLLKGLLERNVEKRLGCGKSSMFQTRGVSALKQHPFFKVLPWRPVVQGARIFRAGVLTANFALGATVAGH